MNEKTDVLDPITHKSPSPRARRAVERFNNNVQVGGSVRYWTGLREGEGKQGTLRAPAFVCLSGYPVAFVNEHRAYILLTHIEPESPIAKIARKALEEIHDGKHGQPVPSVMRDLGQLATGERTEPHYNATGLLLRKVEI